MSLANRDKYTTRIIDGKKCILKDDFKGVMANVGYKDPDKALIAFEGRNNVPHIVEDNLEWYSMDTIMLFVERSKYANTRFAPFKKKMRSLAVEKLEEKAYPVVQNPEWLKPIMEGITALLGKHDSQIISIKETTRTYDLRFKRIEEVVLHSTDKQIKWIRDKVHWLSEHFDIPHGAYWKIMKDKFGISKPVRMTRQTAENVIDWLERANWYVHPNGTPYWRFD